MIGPLFWSLWLCGIVGSFAVGEGLALDTNGETLSMFIWRLSEAWPPFEWVSAFLCGALAVHFYWHWLPPGAVNTG